MTLADSCRMGEIEDLGMVGLEYMGRLLRVGVILCLFLWVDLLEWGDLCGSGMGCHRNVLLKTNARAGEAEIEGLI